MRLNFEFATNVVEVNWFHKVTKFLKYICTSARIKGFLRQLKVLKLGEKLGKLVKAWYDVHVNC